MTASLEMLYGSLKSAREVLGAASWLMLIALSPSSAQQREPEEDYICAKNGDVRRIEIRFANDPSQLPCEVVYRPQSGDDAVGTVSWRGIDKVDQCKAQAVQVVDRLKSEGWACTQISAPDRQDEDEPQEIIIDAQSAETAEGGGRSDALAALAPDPAEEQPAPIEDEVVKDDGPLIPVLLDNPDLSTPSPKLEATIKDNLEMIAGTLDGSLEAEILAYDDLNADDIDDALIIMTYVSPQPAYRQFLTAYLFDGDDYMLAATRLIASSSTHTLTAALDTVDEGTIKLILETYQPGDETCCPSGSEPLNLALEGLELVKIDENQPLR